MPAPTPPTEAERAARAAFVETKNDVALLIEHLNRGLNYSVDGPIDGFEQMLLDLQDQAPKLGLAAARLRHNLPERADSGLPAGHRRSDRYCLVWPDGEGVSRGFGSRGFHDLLSQRPAAIRRLVQARRHFPEIRLYDVRERVFIDPEEEN